MEKLEELHYGNGPVLRSAFASQEVASESDSEDVHRASRQTFTRFVCDDVGILHTDTTQPGIENLRLDRQNHARLERRVEFGRNHRDFVQFETYAVRDEPDPVLRCPHEMIRKWHLRYAIEDALVNLARNVLWTQLIFNPRVQFK